MMKALTCAATRRRLQAFHDRELSVRDQIAVGAHLEWCDECAEILTELRHVRTALKSLVPSRMVLNNEQAAVFTTTVVSRMKAEEQASLFVRVRSMFEDMHLVYAGVGAAGATAVCIVIMLGMMRFATSERPDSLAAIVNLLATPLECDSGNDLTDASGCRARWAARFQRANEIAEQDAIFTLEAIVTHQGRLANLEKLRTRGRTPSASDAIMVEGLLDGLSRSRLEPAQTLTIPDLAGVVWLLEHATVRANPNPVKPALDLPLPPKKRAATTTRAARLVRA